MKTLVRRALHAAAAVGFTVSAFALTASHANAAVTYTNMQARHSGLCAHVTPDGFTDENRVSQQYCTTNAYDEFYLSPSDAGHWRLVVQATGKCLEVENGSLSNKARIAQASCNSGWQQQWELIPTDSGYYALMNRRSLKCMDVENNLTFPEARIWQWTCDGSGNVYDTNQQFRFV